MAKVLYIEDDLSIATIKKFFSPIVTNMEIINKLNELENEDRVYSEDIVNVCKYCTELEICFRFPDALNKIVKGHQNYDLIIIDRNLSMYDYSDSFEDIKQLLKIAEIDNADERLSTYFEREGDLLLLLLLKLDKENYLKTYYLTANTQDDLRDSQALQAYIELGVFVQDNIIEKGSENESKISEILLDMKRFKIQNRYRNQCNIIRNTLTENDVNQFIDLMEYHQIDKRREFILLLRRQLDNFLHQIAHTLNDRDALYWNPNNSDQLLVKSFIKGFKSNENNKEYGLHTYNKSHNIGYNSIIRNACLSIFEISSDCGVHELSEAINVNSLRISNLTHHTMHSLKNQFLDFILWYGKAMDSIKKNQGTNS